MLVPSGLFQGKISKCKGHAFGAVHDFTPDTPAWVSWATSHTPGTQRSCPRRTASTGRASVILEASLVPLESEQHLLSKDKSWSEGTLGARSHHGRVMVFLRDEGREAGFRHPGHHLTDGQTEGQDSHEVLVGILEAGASEGHLVHTLRRPRRISERISC